MRKQLRNLQVTLDEQEMQSKTLSDEVKNFEQRNVGGNQPPNRHGNGHKAWRKDEANSRRLHELL